jgi:hypothetical protein
MLKRKGAFVMADSMVALAIISLGILSFSACQVQLHQQQRQLIIKLTAARLAKEASAGYHCTHRPTTIKRGPYIAVARKGYAEVTFQHDSILRIGG